MTNNSRGIKRYHRLQYVVLLAAIAILGRLFYVQIIDDRYEAMAVANIIRTDIEFPMRGEVLDRRGEYLIRSRVCYDVMVVTRDIPREGFDSVRLATILNISMEKLRRELRRAGSASRTPHLVAGYLSQEAKLIFDESNFKGFYTRFRTAREYPRQVGGNLLGYVSEVNNEHIRKWEYYSAGDYIGVGGVESAYETLLRGEKGISYHAKDTRGAIVGPYMNGELDVLPVKGTQLTSTIDGRLQEFAEHLMVGKVGAVVAIEPSTGEILVMVSSPTYNPDLMVGRQRNANFLEMTRNQRQPQFTRALKEHYAPGSTFKLVQGLIGLEEGVLTPGDKYPCHNGYTYGVGRNSRTMKCHSHSSPLTLRRAVAESCNAYFCYVFKDIITNPKYRNIKEGVRKWNEYVFSFGFGDRLGCDLYGESKGFVPTPEFYDKGYDGRWNWGTAISCAIGQGEMACTPLQMANLAAIIANRGYYYIPHIIKSIDGRDSIDSRFYERHYTKVSAHNFEPIIDGMWMSVNDDGTSRQAKLEGWDVCGKTGTAEHNRRDASGYRYPDHSTFLSFAPRNNPRIAISVYVEHGGFGSEIAVPIASLIEELYLTDTIKRQDMLQRVLNYKINYGYYDAKQRKYDQQHPKQ
ncbi:MAG: penicillin-binding protein 2 [Alistipes sp.]|nr:penicillin-binding protein 2 [Alistipes sp.]